MSRYIISCVAGLTMALLSLFSRSSEAQAPPQAPGAASPAAPSETPTTKPEAGASSNAQSSDAPLSKKLEEGEGVIKPPHGIDPEMHKAAPANTGDKMPVIVPPGEPGGDQSVQPK